MNEASWNRLLGQIRDGFVVPIIGCRLLVDGNGHSLQAKVAQQLMAAYAQPAEAPPLPLFRELNEAVTRLGQGPGSPARWQDLYADVDHAIRKVTEASDFIVPDPIRHLAEITHFRLFVSLTPDDLLWRSLRQRRAVNEIVHAPKLPTSEGKDLPRDWNQRPGEAQLLYLFGKSRPAPMFAIHDEDILEYAHNIVARGSQVPTAFLGELQQRNLLLIGCNFPDWLIRFFLRATRQNRLSSQAEVRREWLIEPLGPPEESLTCFLRSYSKDTEILSDTPPGEFVAELHRRWMAEHGADPPSTPITGWTPSSQVMFFISYSRQTDLPRAESLYQALLNLGVTESEVWFDRLSIEPGHDFRHRILDGIRNCRYFLPLLSDAANLREEAFVFDEWQEANARKRAMNRDFIFPVVVDAGYDPRRYTAKPLQDGNWAKVHFGYAPEGVPDANMIDKLKKLLRDARKGDMSYGEQALAGPG
jgi:TIR domain-containing protein/SIR2-like protein